MKQNDSPKQKLFFVLMLFSLLLGGLSMAQAQPPSPGVMLFWDKQVGCQIGSNDDKRSIFLEDIEDSECIRVCDDSEVNYELFYLPAGATTTWTVVGGTLLTSSNNGCTVRWENVGMGSISMSIALPQSTINTTLCIEKIQLPKAGFKIVNQTDPKKFVTCSEQLINFINLSTANNGSALVTYHWDFGDGTTSAAYEPSHAYANDGTYTVTLSVYNACNCKATYKMTVIAKRRGFEILCPTVVCEGQSAIYSLPPDAAQACNGYLWSVIGGQIISQGNGNVEVLWNKVDASGFGYVTFDPKNCDLPCMEPTTVKVPVIKSRGTIVGPTELCIKEQGRYKLPKWPTTDIQWEIIGNVNNNLAEIIITDQRNEVIVMPHSTGTLVLRAVYTNTLLGCSGQAEIRINVAAPLEIIGDNTFCENSSGVFTNSENTTVNWILTNSTGTTLANTNATTLSYTFTTAGTYTLTVGSPNFCSVDKKTIVVLPKPTQPAGVDGSLEVCPTATYTYSVQNPDPNSTYSWVVTNGTVLDSNEGTEVNIVFNGTFPATVKVYNKTVSPVECISEPYIFTVNQVAVNAAISSQSSTVCSSSTATYKAFEAGTSTLFDDGDSYTWTISNPAAGSITLGQGTNEVEVLWNEVTTVTNVNLILTIGKCTLNPAPQFIKQITLNPKTQIALTASQNPVCAGSLYTVIYTVSSINGVPLSGTDQITWNLGSGDYTTAPGVFTQSKTFNNNGTTNINVVVSAVIANANSCGASNKAMFTTTVLPNPPAIATSSTPGNAFCNASEVNALITVSSNTTGVTFTWYKNGVLIPGQTGTSLNVGPALNFGAYSFRVTNPNGCINESNVVNIYQACGPPPSCTITASVLNNAALTSCGTITLAATASPAPISSSWSVIGTGAGNYSVSGNTLTGNPGMYNLIYKTVYPCQQGGTGEMNTSKQVVIPYKPDFSYIVSCNANNTFNVNFIDNSNFYSALNNQQVRFYYKAASASTFIGPVTYNPSLTVFEMQNLPAGAYVFKVENSGSYQGTNFPVCQKEYTVNLQGVNPNTAIIVNQGSSVDCHNTSVKFGLNINPAIGSTVLWEFGDGAQNTAQSPQRVYSVSDTTYIVKCTITNPFGCSIVRTATVTIPKECFFGDVVATPANATVCKGESVLLKYVPENDNCAVTNYTWMEGSDPIANAANAPTLSVSTPGFYWVKVSSANDCDYNSPTQISPTFKTLPSVKINGKSRFCEDEFIQFTAVTDATTIQWALDGQVYPQFNNIKVTDWTGNFSAGNFVVTCTVTKNGCSSTASHTFTIEETITDVIVDVAITCTPNYSVTLTADAIIYSGGTVHYNWSNGATGNTITVDDGGPLSVTATTGGGCSFTKQIDVPKNPENYMWIFPTGCYTDCIRKGNYLIGPIVSLNSWSWNNNGQPVSAGSGLTNPFTLTSNGDYSLTINTGVCDLESGVLSFATDKCKECKIEKVEVKDIVKNETKYCSYTQTLIIYSGYGQPFQATLSDPLNNVVLIPSTFTLVPGQNIIQVTVIPQSPFLGGNTTFRLHGLIPEKDRYINCEYMFPVNIPYCGNGQANKTAAEDNESKRSTDFKNCTLYPNPASGTVQLQYDLGIANSTVELYEVTGRLLTQQVLTTSEGTTALNISNYSTGVYIVVVRNENQILYQQKLIIK